MEWNSLGLVLDPTIFDWSSHSALQPTPIVLKDRVRVFIGSRDDSGTSRIGYVDLSIEDPTKVIGYSNKPVLDIGSDGCFDESGVVPSALVKHEKKLYMYYAGYQLGSKVRFSVLGGLAISEDNGESFIRAKKTPVFERTDTETIFRVPHSVIYSNDTWKAWYGGGSHFISGENKTLPVYDIRYTESNDPMSFSGTGTTLLTTNKDEYRLGRPYFYKRSDSEYYLFYGFSTEANPYNLGFAFSTDAIHWQRRDTEFKLNRTNHDWDNEMTAYPSVFNIKDKVYMLYNGNEYGKYGFGIAVLKQW
ncbi:hypothetical protein [Vibrio breoganii]|uniref:hypothetical protein n=1 Tax=Vibrio breoganii TaxID=553239 RepID=UPI000C851258|nr:hypothetical protein [Vibrio breoganii]PML92248.1 hypothetical protein BCT64_16650 [Vibrio breoganii]PMN70187.1 hypothetical protein BCT28_17930 [Vibrio breoganii]